MPIQGRQSGATIEFNPAPGDVRGVMRHEIVHALRDPGLWGEPFGLFSREEWRALVRAARGDTAQMDVVQDAYSDSPASVQTDGLLPVSLTRHAELLSEYMGRLTRRLVMAALFSDLPLMRGKRSGRGASPGQTLALQEHDIVHET